MKDKSGKYFNYVVVSCKDEFLEINWPVKLKIERKFIGYSMIFIDIIICTLFVFFIWYVEYHIRKHVARHRKITFQTDEFALQIDNLPQIDENEENSVEKMEAFIFNSITELTKDDVNNTEDAKIIDITFVMQDNIFITHLDHLVDIDIANDRLEILDAEEMLFKNKQNE